MIEQINSILDIFLHEEEITREDFILIQNLVDIILSIPVSLNNQRYFSRMRLTKSLDYSFKFLESLNVDYAQRLHFMLNNGHISIRPRKRKEIALSTTSIVDGRKHIKLITSGTVEDSYTTTHEFFHYDNMDIENPTINFELMTEGISITSESLQKLWFERQKQQPRDYHLNERDTLYALKVKACKLHFELQLIYRYMEKGEIGYEDIFDIVDCQNQFYRDNAYEEYDDILRNGDLNFQSLQRNVIGGCLSAHILDRVIADSSYISVFKNVHDWCNQMTFVETLKYLGLEVIDEDKIILSNKSLVLLREEYSRKVKRTY